MDDARLARKMWQLLEAYHAVVYFSPSARQRMEEAGLRGFWRGYFATRAAPMGQVPAETVAAVFYNFHPDMVARAIPHVWEFTDPDTAWRTRLDAADAALGEILGPGRHDPGVEAVAGLVRDAMTRCDPAGRPFFASHLHLPWPDQPHLVLWQAATMLREFRGDAHNAALLASGVDGCEAHVLADAADVSPRSQTQPNRGWSDGHWDAAVDRLTSRGLRDAAGVLTAPGAALVELIELQTNRASLQPWERIGAAACDDVLEIMAPIARKIFESRSLPTPNPIGLPPP